jgi:hypothetical protein
MERARTTLQPGVMEGNPTYRELTPDRCCGSDFPLLTKFLAMIERAG